MEADLVIVGAGLFGLTVAQQAVEKHGAKVEIIDVRDHLGGNVAPTRRVVAWFVPIHARTRLLA